MPLETTAALRVDLLDPGAPQIIHAVQDDSDSRKIAFNIYAGGAQWAVPDGTLVTVRYKKPDGTAGFYDTLPDGSTPAATIDDNVVTVALVPQAFTVRGNVPVQIKLYNSAGASIATFAIVMHVSANVVSDAEIVSSDYYSVLTKQIADVLAAAEGIEGNVTAAQAAAEQAASSASQAAQSATDAASAANTAAADAVQDFHEEIGDPIAIVHGGTNASTATDALSNLGGYPGSSAKVVLLWSGNLDDGTATITDAYLYGSLIFVGYAGQGETLTALTLGGSFTGHYQLTSSVSYLLLTLAKSGNDIDVQVDASAHSGSLRFVFGVFKRQI